MNRNEIEQALVPVLPVITEFFASAKQAATLGRFPDRHINLGEVAGPVTAALLRQPEFSESNSRYMDFGGSTISFSPGFFLPKFLEFVAERGATQALDWIDKVLATVDADARCICPVYGLAVSEPLGFGEGKFQLVRFDSLPPSDHKALEQAKAYFFPGGPIPMQMPATSALVTKVHVSKFFHSSTERTELYQSLVALQNLVDALSMATGHQTSPGLSWAEYIDPDLQAAHPGMSGYGGIAEIHPTPIVKAVEKGPTCAFMEGYLRLPSSVKSIVDVANARINQAMRRQRAIDKAVDASIGLEALLGDKNDKNEIGDRLSRRAAVLIGGSLTERRQTKAAVRELYNLRSKVVHTGRSPSGSQEAKNVTDAGIEIGIKAVREIVAIGTMPPWEEWELMGRP